MSTSENSWLSAFPSMSTAMKVQMITNPPPSLNKPTLFRAILDLPYNERNSLIQNIPRNTLRSLILSLPKQTQQSVYKALSKAVPKDSNNNTTNNSENNDNNNNNKNSNNNTNKKQNTKRDRELQAALNLDRSNNGYSHSSNNRSSQIGIGRRKSAKYSTSRRLKKKLEKLSNINGTKNKRITLTQFEWETIEAISDYDDDDDDRCFDPCSKHINFAQFSKEPFLNTIIKMMRAFGDGPRPSRYSGLIILNHIKSYLKCIIDKMEQESMKCNNNNNKNNRNNKKTTNNTTSRKSGMKHLEILSLWYPSQVRVFKKWKHFKFESNKNDKKVPDLANENENDEEEDEDSDIDQETENKNTNKFMETIRDEMIRDEYIIYLNDLCMDIGWGSRLIECDKFTTTMDRRDYFKFTKCRESSLTSYKKKFYSWLNIKPYSKILTYFLGFIAWDRIGCIIQIARKLYGVNHGVIIENKENYLKPTQIVHAILKINNVKQITPIHFIDHSFHKIDLSHIDISTNNNNNNNNICGRKRKLTEIENENDGKQENKNKKMRLK